MGWIFLGRSTDTNWPCSLFELRCAPSLWIWWVHGNFTTGIFIYCLFLSLLNQRVLQGMQGWSRWDDAILIRKYSDVHYNCCGSSRVLTWLRLRGFFWVTNTNAAESGELVGGWGSFLANHFWGGVNCSSSFISFEGTYRDQWLQRIFFVFLLHFT